MAENKTKQTDQSVNPFLEAVPDEQKRKDSYTLIELMQQASGEPAKMWGPSIVGFGSEHYKYESGREGDMPIIGFSLRKQALTLYLKLGGDYAPDLLAKLGKHTTGKGCLYIKKLADVDSEVLKELIAASVKYAQAK